MAIRNPFKKQGCPSQRGGSIDEIIVYWKKSSDKGCGNCMHFGYAAMDPNSRCQNPDRWA